MPDTSVLDSQKRTVQIRPPEALDSLRPRRLPARFALLLIVGMLSGGWAAWVLWGRDGAFAPGRPSAEALDYFRALYKDTWQGLATFVDDKTGLPYDSSTEQPATSMTNVGLYMASVAVARRTGIVAERDVIHRMERCITALERVETWRGIPRPWILVQTLEPTHGDEFSYGPHLGALIAGLTVAKTSFPELEERLHALIRRMDMKYFYDPATGWLKGGYNVNTQNFAVLQSWGHWNYKHFASETRLLSFYLIARGWAPKTHWQSLIRPAQKREGQTFFVDGLDEGGLFTQYMPGLFLDERATEMGRSQRSYARSQMKHAKRIGAPVWGWSASQDLKGRFLAHGELTDKIVAPYASILASLYFPNEAYQNLRTLELLGVRPRLEDRSGKSCCGFRDSFDWVAGRPSPDFLTAHQAMSFLSLANLLHEGVVWKSFREDPAVQKGLELVAS